MPRIVSLLLDTNTMAMVGNEFGNKEENSLQVRYAAKIVTFAPPRPNDFATRWKTRRRHFPVSSPGRGVRPTLDAQMQRFFNVAGVALPRLSKVGEGAISAR